MLCAAMVGVRAPAAEPAVPVTVDNFKRAETDMYFAKNVSEGAFGKMAHLRVPTEIDKQTVIRMNRDTLYSSGVFDLDAGPVTIELPDAGKRFMSLMAVDEDHYTQPVVYAPGSYTFTKAQLGTRYFLAAVRTLVDASDPRDIKAANAAQDKIVVRQAKAGEFKIPNWDPKSRDEIRSALLVLAARSGNTNVERFGLRNEVDPIAHLLATAAGWGGNPSAAAVYDFGVPSPNDGRTMLKLTVRDVPVDAFWSISVYNAKGFFEKNELNSYSLNSLTAKPNADGSFTVQFGGCTAKSANCLVTPAGWNYVVRLYKPRKPILDGTWKFPVPAAAP
jgi:para-nitrobenzyl esterase